MRYEKGERHNLKAGSSLQGERAFPRATPVRSIERLGNQNKLGCTNASMEASRWLIGKNQSPQFALSGTAHSVHGSYTLFRF